MYVKLEPFGYNIYGETIGSVWLSLVEAINKNGVLTEDEGRKRLSSQNIGYKEAGVKDRTKYKFPMSEKYPTYYDHEKEEKYEKRNRS